MELTKSFCGVVEKSSLSVLCQLINALLKGPPQANPQIPAAVMAAKSKVWIIYRIIETIDLCVIVLPFNKDVLLIVIFHITFFDQGS